MKPRPAGLPNRKPNSEQSGAEGAVMNKHPLFWLLVDVLALSIGATIGLSLIYFRVL